MKSKVFVIGVMAAVKLKQFDASEAPVRSSFAKLSMYTFSGLIDIATPTTTRAGSP